MIPSIDQLSDLEAYVAKPKSHRKPNRARFASIIIRELECRAADCIDCLFADEPEQCPVVNRSQMFIRYSYLLRLAAELRAEFGIPL